MAGEERITSALDDTAHTGVRVVRLRIVNYALAFGASVLIARSLGPEGRGLYALPIAYLGIVMALDHAGIEHANVRLASIGVGMRSLWGTNTVAAILLSLGTWLMLALVRVLGGPDSFGGLPTPWLVVTFAQVPALLMVLYWTNLLQLAHQVRGAMLAAVAGTALHAGLIVVLFVTDALSPFRVLVLTWVLNGAVWILLLSRGARSGLVSFRSDRPLLRRALAFGLRAHIATLFWFLLLRVDQILVQDRLGFEALGLYSLAVVLAEMVFRAADPFAVSLLPHQVRAERGDDRRLADATTRLTIIAAVAAGLVAWFLVPIAIRYAYGNEFVEATWAFRWLLPGVVVLAAQRPLQTLVIKQGRLGLATALNASALAVDVTLNLVLLEPLGVVGASVASTITYVLLGIAYVAVTRDRGGGARSDLIPRRADVARLFAAFGREPPLRSPSEPSG